MEYNKIHLIFFAIPVLQPQYVRASPTAASKPQPQPFRIIDYCASRISQVISSFASPFVLQVDYSLSV